MKEEPKVLLSTRNLELTDSIRCLVDDNLDKLFEHSTAIERARVELALESHSKTHAEEFIAKGHLEVRGQDLHVTCQADDLHLAVAEMARKLDRMLRKRSAVRIKKRNHPHAIDIAAELPKAV